MASLMAPHLASLLSFRISCAEFSLISSHDSSSSYSSRRSDCRRQRKQSE